MDGNKRILAVALLVAVVATPVSAGAHLSSLDGEWTSDCLPIGKNGRHGTIIRLTIRDGSMRADSQLYARNTCQQPTVRSVFQADLILDGQQQQPDALDLELMVKEMLTIANAPDIVEHYNQQTEDQAGCGLTNWEQNVPMSTEGLTCGPFTWPSTGSRLYDSVWVDDSSIRFGALPFTWTNTSPEVRPEQPSNVSFYRTGL